MNKKTKSAQYYPSLNLLSVAARLVASNQNPATLQDTAIQWPHYKP